MLLLKIKHASNAGVGLVDRQHLMSCMFALKDRLDGDALIKAIHANQTTTAFHMFFLIKCSYGSDEFVGQRNCKESYICACGTFYLKLVLKGLLPFLNMQQLL